MANPCLDSPLPGFERTRVQMLANPRLKGIDPSEVMDYLNRLPSECFSSVVYSAEHISPYIQPRGGYATFERQKKLTRALDGAGADILPLTIDSYTRQNDHERAQLLMEQSEEHDRDFLNGYPLVNYGFEITRLLFSETRKPVSLRHGTPDARILVETAIASGITEIEGGGICYCLPYSMSFPLDRALLYWQYVDRLAAIYSTAERPIHREFFGPLTGTMVPPAMMAAISIIELLLAAEQGVLSASVSFSQTGSPLQDSATATVLRKLSREYLDHFGFTRMKVYLVFHHWMGAFPKDRRKAEYLMSSASLIAKMIKADKVITKTRDEAWGIPSIEANVDGVQQASYVMSKFACIDALTSQGVERERLLIERETRAIVDAVLSMGGGSFWYSVYRAAVLGMIDIPYAPNVINRNRLITVRDSNRSIRIKNPGNVPLSADSMREEQALLREFPRLNISTADQMLGDIYMML